MEDISMILLFVLACSYVIHLIDRYQIKDLQDRIERLEHQHE